MDNAFTRKYKKKLDAAKEGHKDSALARSRSRKHLLYKKVGNDMNDK